ncbi:hypothetical protein [Pantoea sp. AMG 501]|uniref:hypothetical protein n=1 Tax=Pantoea sp. AMG 501 TaxID=2008894 RepID=UPI000B5A31B9|nr:hypothetical protein [Pantoea sp. AMG 501]OWY74696.1 hypothetical protein CDN97_22030 [Pantoea sp. AMG 501]
MLIPKNKRPVLAACVVGLLIGWGGCNLSDWYTKIRNIDSDGFGPLYNQNKYHCMNQTRPLLLQSAKDSTSESQSAYHAAYFDCMTKRLDALNLKVAGAVEASAMLYCSMKTGDKDKSVADACTQKTLDEFAMRHTRPLPKEK